MKTHLYALLGLVLMISCSTSGTKLETALEQSGANRKEMEKVLRHFSGNTSDSLQLRAAEFLIANMPGHYSLESSRLIRYREAMDSLYPAMSNIVKRVVYTIPLREHLFNDQTKIIGDIETVRSEYLIRHIDNAIQMWNSCSWLRAFTFEDFCEYLLPYRITNEPLLENDSTSYLWKSVSETMDYYGYEPKMLGEIKSLQRDLLGHSDDTYIRGVKMPLFSDKTYKFECLDVCYYELGRLRAVGIPSAIDFVPGWPYRNGRHYWRVMIDPAYVGRNNSDRLNSKAPKVYRMTYSHNPVPVSNGKDSIPPLFREPFYKDVSREYLNVSDIKVKATKKITSPYVYLAIFNDLEWNPIAWTTLKNNEAVFEDVGRYIVYLPIYYVGGTMKNIGYPMLLDAHGGIKTFVPDKENRTTMRISRKFPFNDYKVVWSESLKGCHIVASNQPDFNNADTLYTIAQSNPDLNYITISLENTVAYRYYKICKDGSMLHIGDWQLFSTDNKKVSGRAIPSKENDSSAQNAFDEDVLTYTDFSSWLGVDLGKKEQISVMKIVTRTDDNGIIPGNVYELVYFDENGWKTLETKQATDDFLDFDSVPTGALFWLKNLTAGQEERIFSYEGKKVRFW